MVEWAVKSGILVGVNERQEGCRQGGTTAEIEPNRHEARALSAREKQNVPEAKMIRRRIVKTRESED